MDKINYRILWAAHLGHLAWALASAGEVDEAMEVLSKALLAVDECGERVCEAELHRLRGDMLWQRGVVEEAEIEFCRAVEIARSQKAGAWELRAATSLAQLHADRGHKLRHSKSSRRSIPGLPRTSIQRICVRPEHFSRLWS